jgi:prephenate dehydrogenase
MDRLESDWVPSSGVVPLALAWRIEAYSLPRFGTAVIIGVGLIGGSIGLALRARRLASHVIGVGRNPVALEHAVRLGAIDRGTTDLEAAVADADLVIVCTPVNRIAVDVLRIAEAAPTDVLITDVGSSKRQIVEAIERHARSVAAFVGAHPIAGSERRGALHARADLFDGRVCIITPTPRTPLDRTREVLALWTSLGCRVVEMSPVEHDEILAYTSHLPHAVAAALAASVPGEWLPLAAGAYRDGTRVAAADTELWAAIFRENRGPMLKALGTLQKYLDTFKYALMTDDESAIRSWWEEARSRRALFLTEVELAPEQTS